MSEPFDPYYQWLGIRREEEPPDHYRLLGIQRFESDANIIRTAAEQRFVYLRTFQLSPQASLAEMLLNEVAAAKVCLLDLQAKARYDAGLSAALGLASEIPEGSEESSKQMGRAKRPLPIPPKPPPPIRPEPVQADLTEQPPPLPRPEPPPLGKPGDPGTASFLSPQAVPVGLAVPPLPRRPWFHNLLRPLKGRGLSWLLAMASGAVVASLLVVAGLVVGRLTDRSTVRREAVQDGPQVSTPRVSRSDEVGPSASAGKAATSSEAAPGTPKAAGHDLSTDQLELGQPMGPSPPATSSGRLVVRVAEGHTPGSPLEAGTSAVAAAQGERPASKSDVPAIRPPEQGSRDRVAEAREILLPSGRSFGEKMIVFDRDALRRLRDDLAKKAGSVLVVPGSKQFGAAYAQSRSDSLDGVVVVCDRERRETLQVTCEHGTQQGWLVLLNSAGQRVYACQYRLGTREGFGCLFDSDQLRMVVEYLNGRRGGLVMVAGGKVAKSYAKAEDARSDKDGFEALARMDESEIQVDKTIDELQKRLRLALEQRAADREEQARKAAAAAHSVEARKKAQVTHEQLEEKREENERIQRRFHGLP